MARFIVTVIARLDLRPIYARYAPIGGEAIDPVILLELHPDRDTLATFWKACLPEIKALFVEVLLMTQHGGALSLRNISLDGSKIHADASKSRAVSYGRLTWQP